MRPYRIASGCAPPLHSTAKTVDSASIAFGWLAFVQSFDARHGFALFGQLEAQLAAGVGLAIERAGHRGRAADFAQGQNLHLKIAAIVLHLEQVADADVTRRLDGLSVGMNPAEFAGPRGEGSRLEESGGPQPFVNSHELPRFSSNFPGKRAY